MAGEMTRRGFLGAMVAADALGGWLPALGAGWASAAHPASDEPRRSGAGSRQRAVEADIRRRARWQLAEKRLVVDYYRIGRKLAYPLPLSSLVIPEVRVPSIPGYPWPTWLLWTLEERIDCLGWAAEWFGDEQARQAAAARLARPAFAGFCN